MCRVPRGERASSTGEQANIPQEENPEARGFSGPYNQRPLRSLLVGNELEVIVLLVVGQHHRDPVPQGEVFPGDIESLAIFVRPDRADAGPDFLTALVLARVPAVVEDIRWGVWHGNVR
jgi:hypothetical protein